MSSPSSVQTPELRDNLTYLKPEYFVYLLVLELTFLNRGGELFRIVEVLRSGRRQKIHT